MKVSKLAENLIGSEIIKIGNQVNDLKSDFYLYEKPFQKILKIVGI